jgi:hypothetical protein
MSKESSPPPEHFPAVPHRGEGLPVEIGWVLAGRFDDIDQAAIRQCRETTLAELRRIWPCFDWRLAVVQREVLVRSARVEPISLLDEAVSEASAKTWDYTFVITPADLVSHYQPFSSASVARSLAAAAISTARIDPAHSDPTVPEADRIDAIARRLRVLVLHSLAHLVGLGHSTLAGNMMNLVDFPQGIDRAEGFGTEQIERVATLLREVADPRLEERSPPRRPMTPWFYVQSAWINRREIVAAVVEAEPWRLPFRLGRLTTAAGSALVVLLVTAEVWDLAMGLAFWWLAVLAVAATAASTGFVIARQRLLYSPDRQGPTELSVIRRLSTVAIMLLGMMTAYALLFCIALMGATLLFRASLVSGWATSLSRSPGWGHYAALSAFVASLGLMVGAFGASFENQYYFRHVTHVDEEL